MSRIQSESVSAGRSRLEIARGVIQAWGRILRGRRPSLSVEITKECPLRCPGCYAYGDAHLGGHVLLRGLTDYRGDELVDRFIALVNHHRPLHVSIVGGEPLVRYRELGRILPWLADRNIHAQVVTSAVRQIPREWRSLRRLQMVVSVDGLAPEHDARRTPATYARILQHIRDHAVTIHCTVTRQQVRRARYLEDFIAFWNSNPDVNLIWISLYTPQVGEVSPERLTPADRAAGLDELRQLRGRYAKLQLPDGMLEAYRTPPASPADCVFARTTTCLSADLQHRISPCQYGGNPDCSNCGCVASAGMTAIARHRLPGGLRVGSIFNGSLRIGRVIGRGHH